MKSRSNYRNVDNLHSLLKFFYYATIAFAFTGLITTFAIPFVPDTAISFERGIREWAYSVDLPIGIGSASLGIQGSIPKNILQFVPIDYINIPAAIVIAFLMSNLLPFILVIIGLKKMTDLTTDMLNKESPFQLKHVKSVRKLSYLILLYSTLGNTLLCILISLFVTDYFSVTFDFAWSGILIGIMGYIFSDITEHGIFLQDEYDTTL